MVLFFWPSHFGSILLDWRDQLVFFEFCFNSCSSLGELRSLPGDALQAMLCNVLRTEWRPCTFGADRTASSRAFARHFLHTALYDVACMMQPV